MLVVFRSRIPADDCMHTCRTEARQCRAAPSEYLRSSCHLYGTVHSAVYAAT